MAANHNKMRNDLISGAIKAIAKHGLDGATAKRVAKYSNLNEAYIYRYYEDIEDLFNKAFFSFEKEFHKNFVENSPILADETAPLKERFFKYMENRWKFLTDNMEKCVFFVRYLYSSHCVGDVLKEHQKNNREYFRSFLPMFKNAENIDFYMFNINKAILTYVLAVNNGTFKNDEKTKNMIFEYIYEIFSKHIAKV